MIIDLPKTTISIVSLGMPLEKQVYLPARSGRVPFKSSLLKIAVLEFVFLMNGSGETQNGSVEVMFEIVLIVDGSTPSAVGQYN